MEGSNTGGHISMLPVFGRRRKRPLVRCQRTFRLHFPNGRRTVTDGLSFLGEVTMQKLWCLVLVFLGLSIPGLAADEKADALLAKGLKALGGEEVIAKFQAATWKGT